jgi:hypothetical protein
MLVSLGQRSAPGEKSKKARWRNLHQAFIVMLY